MADVVNLRRARKRKERAAKEQQSTANRAKFGRTKGERVRADREADRSNRSLDGAKMDDESGR